MTTKAVLLATIQDRNLEITELKCALSKMEARLERQHKEGMHILDCNKALEFTVKKQRILLEEWRAATPIERQAQVLMDEFIKRFELGRRKH